MGNRGFGRQKACISLQLLLQMETSLPILKRTLMHKARITKTSVSETERNINTLFKIIVAHTVTSEFCMSKRTMAKRGDTADAFRL